MKSSENTTNQPAAKKPAKKVVSSGGNLVKSGVKKKTAKKKAAKKRLPPGTISRTGQQPEAEIIGSGGVDPTKPIGPGNPARAACFKPGQSGNPKGYPKGQLQTKTILKYWLSQKETITNPMDPTGKKLKVRTIDVVALGLITKARKGDVAAAREILDRVDGKPVQSNKIILPRDKTGVGLTIGFAAPGLVLPKPKKEDDKDGSKKS